MMTVSGGSRAVLFVSNVLNGTVAANGSVVHRGRVLRLTLKLRGSSPPILVKRTVIGSGFGERTDPAALVVGPTGLGLNSRGTLFVADSVGNRITAIPGALVRGSSAGTGRVVTTGGKLSTPLGLAIAPNGHVLTVNGGNGKLVETTRAGRQIASKLLDNTGSPPGAGALFGLALAPHARGIYYVDDAANTLKLLH
jgi:DNA-binding beta-propeller fold protein YncE